MKKQVFYKPWWVHLIGIASLLIVILFLKKKEVLFNQNKNVANRIESKGNIVTEKQFFAGLANNLAKDVKDLQTAEELFKQSLENIPEKEKYKVLYNLGMAYANHGEHEKAIKKFSAAIELNNNCYDCFVNRAYSYEKIYELKLALKDYDTAIQIDPNGLRAYFSKATSYDKLYNDYSNSRKNFLKCIELDKKYYDAYLGLIYLNLIFDYINEAEFYLNELKNISTSNIEVYSAYLIGKLAVYIYLNDVKSFFLDFDKFMKTDTKEQLFLNKTVEFSYVSPVIRYGIVNNLKNKKYSLALEIINYTLRIALNRNMFEFVKDLNEDKVLIEKLIRNEIPNFEYKDGMLAISK